MSKFRDFGLFIIFYIVSFGASILGLYFIRRTSNVYLVSIVFALLISILMLLFLILIRSFSTNPIVDRGLIRYTMLCKACNWEWMSNTTEKGIPSRCPNCGGKDKLDVIGWRKVQYYQGMKNQELTKFLGS